MTMKHHGDAVADLREFVEILACQEDRGTCSRKIEQRLTDDGGSPGIDAPCRLAHDENGGIAQDFASNHKLLQIAAGQ